MRASAQMPVTTGGPSGADYDLYLVNSSDGTLKSSTGNTVAESVTYANGASAAGVASTR